MDYCQRETKLECTVITRAFAFASELLAKYHLEPWNLAGTQQTLNRRQSFDYRRKSIAILREGDLERKPMAAHSSKKLSVWFKSYCYGEKIASKSNRAKGEDIKNQKAQTRDILSEIARKSALDDGARAAFRGEDRRTRWRRKWRAEIDSVLSSLCKNTLSMAE